MNFIVKEDKNIPVNQLETLYSDVGWTAYTCNLDLLQQACRQSLAIFSAWQEDKLIGLVRVIGDGLTILYIQDILVLTSHQNKGIATHLLQLTLEKYNHVRQHILLTEEAPDVRHFYEKNGFTSCDKGELVAFAKMNA